MNAAIAYLRAFIDGNLESFTTHVVLIGVIAAAEISLGVGIWLESPKDKKFREWFGLFLVLGGCVVSVIFTVLLLIFDEGIGRTQQSKIIKLETELAKVELPRTLSQDAKQRVAAKLRKYEGTPFDLSVTPAAEDSFLEDIRQTLSFAHWDHLAYGGFALSFDEIRVRDGQPHAGVIGLITGVVVSYENASLKEAAEALAKALREEDLDARAKATDGRANERPPMKPNVMHIHRLCVLGRFHGAPRATAIPSSLHVARPERLGAFNFDRSGRFHRGSYGSDFSLRNRIAGLSLSSGRERERSPCAIQSLLSPA